MDTEEPDTPMGFDLPSCRAVHARHIMAQRLAVFASGTASKRAVFNAIKGTHSEICRVWTQRSGGAVAATAADTAVKGSVDGGSAAGTVGQGPVSPLPVDAAAPVRGRAGDPLRALTYSSVDAAVHHTQQCPHLLCTSIGMTVGEIMLAQTRCSVRSHGHGT